MKLEELVGERLVIGIPGTRITPEIVRHFKDLHAGGLILYRINFDSGQQICRLVADLEEALGRKLLVTADHEGGRVIMFRDGITVFPDNLAVGTTGKIDYARQQGQIEAKELRRLGLDVNLGPVLDVLTEAYSPNIGIRSYGKDWRLVAQMGAARIAAMQQGGLSACAKHFPGKGHAPVDAHLGLPVIQSTW
jgi:beta-N-acetylhexosaminidase